MGKIISRKPAAIDSFTYSTSAFFVLYEPSKLEKKNPHNMFLTQVLLKKVKAKDILVGRESIVSGHKINLIRPRLGDKLEIIRFDPWSELPTTFTRPCHN